MKLIKTALVAAMATSLSACVIVVDANGASASVESKKTLTIPTSELQNFDISAGAGELIVIGKPDINQISVDATIYTTEQNPDGYELSLKQNGSTARLHAETESGSFHFGNSPRIDLTITMPANMTLNIEDGSGDIEVRSVYQGVSISDGSGDIELSDVRGQLSINDGSGEIHIEATTGDVDIKDGSGEMQLENVKGNVSVSDGSGDILISKVTGALDISDGSGEMVIKNIRGMVNVSDGSGDIVVKDADGLTVTSAGSGDLKITDVDNVTTL